MAARVRAHPRKKPGGGTTNVRQHSRAVQPGRPLVSFTHAFGLLERSFRAGRRKKRGLAFTLAGLAVAEGVATLTLDGITLAAVTAGILCALVAAAGLSARGRFH